MNYQKIYKDFINDRSKKEPEIYKGYKYDSRWNKPSVIDGVYYEHHHILPRSLGGGDEPENIVSLNFADHYFAHCCLAKIYGGTMYHALNAMTVTVGGRDVSKYAKRVMVVAAKQKWTEDRTIWTKDVCIDDAKNYQRRSDWRESSGGAYVRAHREGWIEECCAHMEPSATELRWTKEACKEDALKYKNRNEWRRASYAYQVALINGWGEDCCSHMSPSATGAYWAPELCHEDAMKYETRKAWQLGSPKSYDAAHRNGWIEKCCQHMKNGRIKWTKERCKQDALKYESRNAWKKSNGSAYNSARKNGWFEECCAHMKKGSLGRPRL